MSEETKEVQEDVEEVEETAVVPESDYEENLDEKTVTVRKGEDDETTFNLKVPTGFKALHMLPKVMAHLEVLSKIEESMNADDSISSGVGNIARLIKAVAEVEEEILFYTLDIEKDKKKQKFVLEDMYPGEIVRVFNACATYMSFSSLQSPAARQALKN